MAIEGANKKLQGVVQDLMRTVNNQDLLMVKELVDREIGIRLTNIDTKMRREHEQ